MAPPTVAVAPAQASRADWFVLVLLGVSLLTNVLLSMTAFRLAGRALPAAALSAGQVPVPAIGTLLPALDAHGVGGDAERLAFEPSGRPTLLYVFAPTCRWCAMNVNNAKTVFAAAADTHRVVALSLGRDAGGFVRDLPTQVQVLVDPASSSYEAYRFGSTPMTLVISPEGRVQNVWVGAYSGTIGKEVESHFGVALPGLVREAGVDSEGKGGRP